MKTAILKFIAISIAAVSITGCASRYQRYNPESLPFVTYQPEEARVAVISPPPILTTENPLPTKRKIKSQYFKIAIPPCMDKTNQAANYINPIADMFYTALYDTKRFNLMDRGELSKIESFSIKEISEKANVADSANAKINTAILAKQFEMAEKSSGEFRDLTKKLQSYSDGVLAIYITSVKTNPANAAEKIVSLDYRIVSTNSKNPLVLYANSSDVICTHDRQSGNLIIRRKDINSIAEDIRKKFPNPDLQTNWKIVSVKDEIITVNAGKNNNITPGMVGYVIKVEEGADGTPLIFYRALFTVTEVFAETFNAELIPEWGGSRGSGVSAIVSADEMEARALAEEANEEEIIRSTRLGEPIKMK